MSYTMIDQGRAIRCNMCGSASYSAQDIRQKYCGRCHKFHNDPVKRRDYVEPVESPSWPHNPYNPYMVNTPALPADEPAQAEICRADPPDTSSSYDASPCSTDSGSSSSYD
jgi:ribosomal protein L37E